MLAENRSQFVGRDRELGELLAELDQTRAGHGRVVVVGGEPGIGKSRLADELAARAEAVGCTVLWGRAWEDAGAPPYWPWVQAFRALIRSAPGADHKRYLSAGATDLAQILPELRTEFPDLPAPAATDSEAARFQLFDSAATFLRNAAADRPIVLVLDDLHAADTPSILLLRFLAGQLADFALLAIGTYRDLELTPQHPLTGAIAEMARERSTRLMMLGGLGSDAVGDYIEAAANVRPDGLTAAAVWRETNGNPLFVGEALRLLEAEGRLGDVADLASLRVAVPAGVQAVIARRIGHLGADAASALETAAVIGPEFPLEVLRKTADLTAANAGAAMDEAVRSGLLLPVAGPLARYRFAHDLIRETLYEQLPGTRRGTLHARIGRALEATYGSGSDVHVAELAFHFSEAAQLADDDDTTPAVEIRARAMRYSQRAANQAIASLAYEDASRLYGMALAALDSDSDSARADRAGLLLAIGEAEALAGRLDRARESLLEAAAIARDEQLPLILARAALSYGGRHQWTRAGFDSLLVPMLEEAITTLGSADNRLRVRLLARLAGAWRGHPSRFPDCERLSREALELARDTGDEATLAYALVSRFWATWWPDNPEQRDSLVSEIVGLAEDLGDGEHLAEARFVKFLNFFEQGRLTDARRALNELADVVRRTRQPAHIWLEPVSWAEIALFDGNFAEAEALIGDELRAGFRLTPGRDDVSAERMHRFMLRRHQGRVAEQEAAERSAVQEFPWYPMHQAALCLLLAETGRSDEARELFAQLARDDFAIFPRDNEWFLGVSFASQACVLVGDPDAADVLYRLLTPFPGRHSAGHAEGSTGVVDHYLGILAAQLMRLDDADRHLTDAIAWLDERGGRPWAARARHDLANVLRQRDASGDRQRASDLDSEAARIAEQIGMAPLVEIARVDERSPNVTRREAPADVARFAREGDYWAVDFGSDSFRVRDSKGMHHLARLLRSPGREIHSLDLVHADGSGASSNGSSEATLTLGDPSDTGPVLDAAAKAAYRERLSQIGEDIAEAERWNDPERVALLAAERSALIRELAAAVGLGDRDRPGATSSAERARVSVTRAVRAAMERISEYSPDLGAHLEVTIRTGTYCAYIPDPRAPITWEN